MFKRLDEDPGRLVDVRVDGEIHRMPEGDNLAAQLLLLNDMPFRIAETDASPRAPHCMIGSCFECLVEIDGQKNQQACMAQVRAGVRVRRQLQTDGDGDSENGA